MGAVSRLGADGLWISGVKVLGYADKLDVLAGMPKHVVGSVPADGPRDPDGWTHYELRGLDLFSTTNDQGAGFVNGKSGPFLGLLDGFFTKVDGFDNANSPSNALLFQPDGTPTNAGAMVIAQFVFEVPDAPFGDANSDHRIDLDDFGLLKANFDTSGHEPFSDGDLTGNGRVNLNDFAVLKQNFGWRAPLVAAPEPTALLLFGVGIAGVVLAAFRFGAHTNPQRKQGTRAPVRRAGQKRRPVREGVRRGPARDA